MGRERYALLFQPGVYGSATEPLMIQIGYYTEVAGLGQSPQDVRIMGKIEVYNRCFEKDPYQDGKFIPTDNSEEGLCFALNSFWRGLSNLSIQIITPGYQDTCRATAMFWAISQAASMRRVSIEGGDVSLMDYCSNPAYASGGFIADSKIGGKIISGSQQQFLTRNSNVGEWSGSAWNQVLLGVTGAPADDSKYPDPAITTIESNPANRERPWLYVDDAGAYNVFVPAFTSDTKDTSWSLNGGTPGKSIPISDFYVAKPGDAVSEINEQLSAGKHLLLTPGVYDADESILVERADTVVLGLGIATLTAVNGAVPLKVSSQPGIIVAGVTFDGGLTLSPVLLQVGALGDPLTSNGDPNNPITLSDVYFRIGGPHIGKSNVCLEINSNHVLVDHTWVWRADHGVEDFDKSDGFDGDNERWATNTGLNGVIVNGNDVTATGLFVEHFQEYNLCWNGERGRVFFFQNELPYEPPSQAEWTADDGTLGWAAYKVSDAVTEHELWCGGVYCYNRNNPDVVTVNAFEVPERDGVVLNRIYTRNLSGPGTIQHIVNGVGRSVTDAEKGPFYVIQYP
ncbi:secreted protein [Seminavis robusta]|uniref:Secreted protein n=1 Tax=Seminavis robusta TaxID=568900 RepID=A0A9N8EI13_9STRA|nr:secreted protein [Seminavis robusta]|eukprot:Sro1112_g242520.1 secreted protein (568) ;mRNA; r:18329-20312